MALGQRIKKVGKDPYLLELSKLHKIGAHAQPLPLRITLLLAPTRIDGPNSEKSRHKSHFLSLKTGSQPYCTFFVVPVEKKNSLLSYSFNLFT